MPKNILEGRKFQQEDRLQDVGSGIDRSLDYLTVLDHESLTLIDGLYDHIVNQVIYTQDSDLHAAASYIFREQGKLARPKFAFVLATAYSKKYTKELTTLQKTQIRDWALVMEIVHNSSLLQDDIIDNAVHRRGQKTTHQLFGVTNTSILPLFLVGRAGQLIKSIDVKGMYQLYAQVIYDLPYGEQLQKRFKRNFLAQEQPMLQEFLTSYLVKTYYKTGSLFSGVIRGVAKILDLSEEKELALFRMGVHIGVAFQISDDLLDITQHKEGNLQKDKLNDLSEMNITAPYLMLLHEKQQAMSQKSLRTSGEASFEELLALIKRKNRSTEDYRTILKEFHQSSAEIKTSNLAVHHLNLASSLMHQFADEQDVQYLMKFGRDMVFRTK